MYGFSTINIFLTFVYMLILKLDTRCLTFVCGSSSAVCRGRQPREQDSRERRQRMGRLPSARATRARGCPPSHFAAGRRVGRSASLSPIFPPSAFTPFSAGASLQGPCLVNWMVSVRGAGGTDSADGYKSLHSRLFPLDPGAGPGVAHEASGVRRFLSSENTPVSCRPALRTTGGAWPRGLSRTQRALQLSDACSFMGRPLCRLCFSPLEFLTNHRRTPPSVLAASPYLCSPHVCGFIFRSPVPGHASVTPQSALRGLELVRYVPTNPFLCLCRSFLSQPQVPFDGHCVPCASWRRLPFGAVVVIAVTITVSIVLFPRAVRDFPPRGHVEWTCALGLPSLPPRLASASSLGDTAGGQTAPGQCGHLGPRVIQRGLLA